MEDRCSNGAPHLEGGQAAGKWDERVKRSQMGMFGRPFFEYFRLESVFERRGNDSAADNLKTGDDGRCCGPRPSCHLLKSESRWP